MAQKTSPTRTREFNTLDNPNGDCPRCGSMAIRQFDDHRECTGCSLTQHTYRAGTRFDSPDGTSECTDAEMKAAIEAAEKKFQN